ncbi:MAG: ABC transporter ATP-binding protein [Symbiobacteriaceae bacterium]|nr:ABC transporter ATP-binding protein [Symbiobacteriaceae bacterium]
MPVIDIQGLTKVYGAGRGVFDLTLALNRGDIFGFLGPNGAGKTTAMKMITGLVHPDAGKVTVLGHDISQEPTAALRQMGCILETAELYPYLTAYENLQQVTRFYPELPPERPTELLELVGMGRYAREKAQRFSLGMKQRVGLAMAMVHYPKVLILDEPFNGLDVEGMVLLRGILQRLAAEEQVTIFISSHLIHDVELTCNRIGILLQGKLVRQADTAEIRGEYASLESFFLSEVQRHERL